MIPLVHVYTCTCRLKLLHGATDSIYSVRAAFSTGIKWGPHRHSGCVTAGPPLLAVWGSGFAVLSSLAVWGLMVGSKGSV